MPSTHSRKDLYAIVGLGLMLIQLAAFSIVSPLTLPRGDDWLYVYLGKQLARDPFYTLNNRQFTTLNITLMETFFPDRVQALFYFHVFCLWAISLGLFHLLRRLLPGHDWFAFLFATVYLLYIPQNIDHISIWLSTYSWILMICMGAIILFLESVRSQHRAAWGMLVLAAILGYVSARGYEGTSLILGTIPVFALLMERRFTQRLMLLSVIWWVFITAGLLQFAIPYLQGDESAAYQTSKTSAEESHTNLFDNSIAYYKKAFMIEDIYPQNEKLNLVPPAIIIMGVFGAVTLLFYRRYPELCHLPSPRLLAISLGIGLIFIEIGGAGYIYADLVIYARSLFFSAPAQALVISSVFGLIAWLLNRTLKLDNLITLSAITCIFCLLATQWFYNHAHQWYPWYADGVFNERTYMFRELVTLLPNVEDNTLMMAFNCDHHFKPTRRTYGVRYLYDFMDGSEIQIVPYLPDQHLFDDTGVTLPPPIPYEEEQTQHIDYSQMIVLRCENEHLVLLEQFPAGYAPEGATLASYNPYLRIQGGFIPRDRWTILAR